MIPVIGSILVVVFHQKCFLKVYVSVTLFLIVFGENLQGLTRSQNACALLGLLIIDADCGELFVRVKGAIGVCSGWVILLFSGVDAVGEVLEFGKGQILLLPGHLVVGFDEIMEALVLRFIEFIRRN